MSDIKQDKAGHDLDGSTRRPRGQLCIPHRRKSIKVANADKKAAAVVWKQAQKAPESSDELVHLLNDPGFEFTSTPHRISHFAAFLNRIGTMKAKVNDWKDLFWETAYNQKGD